MSKRIVLVILIGIIVICLLSIVIYNLPPIQERLGWRVANLRMSLRRAINPPEQVIFVPQEQVALAVQATLQAFTPTVELTQVNIAPETAFSNPDVTSSSGSFSMVTPTSTPIPVQVALRGIVHEYQKFNNCGPANLAMLLSYWGWQGNQYETAAFLRPGEYDKNVSPKEMVAFVEQKTDIEALMRVGGDLETLKRFLAAGYPVLIEKGHDPLDDDWMGHYLTLSGYDDLKDQFIGQDSLIMPDLLVPYGELIERWRDFNHVYIVAYPPERESEVYSLLGEQRDEHKNYEYTANQATQEVTELSGMDLFFAWFNLGTNQIALGDYVNAAQSYDKAFAIYPTIPEDERPWRVLWYQDGPYAAYYNTGRYQDVVDLANNTFFALGEYTLEESFYWRGLAKEALGDHNWALFDLRSAVELNPNFTSAQEELSRLEAETP